MILPLKKNLVRKKKTVLVFGSPLLKMDSLPLRLVPALSKKLPKFDFRIVDPAEELDRHGEHLTILDTVVGIKKVQVFSEKDLENLEQAGRFSVHGFDLGFSLKLLLKLGKIKSAKIIGVPANYAAEKAINEIVSFIST